MNIYILGFIIIILIIFIYYGYYKYSSPNITPLSIPTMPPFIQPTTKYNLTEQAIMLRYTGDYTIPNSREIFNSLLNKNINRSILSTYNSSPFNLSCYVLHTPVFLPDPIKRQGSYYDQDTGLIVNNLTENIEQFDIIGAYFFLNIDKLVGQDNTCIPVYYDTIKKIVIDKTCLTNIFNNLRADNSYKQQDLFTGGSMPMLLDSFVPKLSRFLFYGLGVYDKSTYTYKNLLSKCN